MRSFIGKTMVIVKLTFYTSKPRSPRSLELGSRTTGGPADSLRKVFKKKPIVTMSQNMQNFLEASLS